MANATKASILTFAGRAWQTTFTGTTLDPAINACLSDLNGSDLLVGYATDELAVNNRYFAQPANYKSMIAITLWSGTVTYDSLIELPGGVAKWRSLKAASSAPDRPKYFVEWPSHEDQGILLYPRSDAIYQVEIDYWRTHPESAIEYPAKFQHLLNLGSVYWEAALRRNTEYMNHWGPLYYAERQTRENDTPPICRSAV